MAYRCRLCGQRKFTRKVSRCRECWLIVCSTCKITNLCFDCYVDKNNDNIVMDYMIDMKKNPLMATDE